MTYEHSTAADQYRSPPSKVIAILPKSRDGLQIKYGELKYQAEAGEGRRLPGSSAVLELLIGNGACLDGGHNTRGFTTQLLKMAESEVTATADVITTAMKTCGIRHVLNWCSKHIAPRAWSLRKRDLLHTPAEQKRDKLISHTTPDINSPGDCLRLNKSTAPWQ